MATTTTMVVVTMMMMTSVQTTMTFLKARVKKAKQDNYYY